MMCVKFTKLSLFIETSTLCLLILIENLWEVIRRTFLNKILLNTFLSRKNGINWYSKFSFGRAVENYKLSNDGKIQRRVSFRIIKIINNKNSHVL